MTNFQLALKIDFLVFGAQSSKCFYLAPIKSELALKFQLAPKIEFRHKFAIFFLLISQQMLLFSTMPELIINKQTSKQQQT